MKKSPRVKAFDAAYYDRYYESSDTRVQGASEVKNLGQFVVSFARWSGAEIQSVLDIGAGAGLLRDWFKKEHRKVAYRSTEVSAYACKKYGHERRDISTWKAKAKFDLIVCQGVLPYLDNAACKKAIANIGAMSQGFFYLEAITTRDAKEICDTDKTDTAVHMRSDAFYRKALAPHFVQLGCGLFYSRKGPHLFYDLEKASR